MTKEIALVRHGRHRLSGRYVGRGSDPPLTDRGREQADLAAEALSRWGCDAVYTSPLLRARQTAEPCCSTLGAAPRVLEGLAEIDFGTWEGLSYSEIAERDPAVQAERLRNPADTAPAGGETLRQFRQRAAGAWSILLSEPDARRLAVFAHGGTIRAIVAQVLELRQSKSMCIDVSAASISRLTVYADGVTVVTGLNDVCHLQGTQ